jgi:hypothetical protein
MPTQSRVLGAEVVETPRLHVQPMRVKDRMGTIGGDVRDLQHREVLLERLGFMERSRTGRYALEEREDP